MDGQVLRSEFEEFLRAHKHTLHELRMKLQMLPRGQRADALLSFFTCAIQPETTLQDQEVAGRLLVALLPDCSRNLDDLLHSIAPVWDLSVEQLPSYLKHAFGKEEVVKSVTRLEKNYAAQSREAIALRGIRWWLTGKK